MNTTLKIQVFEDDELHFWKEFDKKNIYVGAGAACQIRLDGFPSVHSLITRADDRMQWRISENVSVPPLHVNGQRVRSADLLNGAMIHFGNASPWSMRVTIEVAEDIEETWDTGHHHDATFDSLCKEIEAADEQAANMIGQVRTMWSDYDESKKRERLRGLVEVVREVRRKKHSPAEKAVYTGIADSLVGFITKNEWMKEVYELSPDQAAAQAAEIFMEISQLQSAIRNLQGFTKKYEEDHSSPAKKAGLDGCNMVQELYGKQLADKAMKLTAYLNRAGGWTWVRESERLDGMIAEFRVNIAKLSEEDRKNPETQKLIAAVEAIGK